MPKKEKVVESLEDVESEDIAAAIDDRARAGITDPEATAETAPAEESAETEVEVEPEVEPTAETPPEETSAEPAEQPTGDDRMTTLEQRLERAELKADAERSRREHLDLMLSRRAGEAGHLRKQLAAQTSRRATETEDPAVDYREDNEAAALPADVQTELDDIRRETADARVDRSERTTQQEIANLGISNREFWEQLEKWPDEARSEFRENWHKRLLQEAGSLGYEDAYKAGDSKRLASIVRASYNSALAETRIEFVGKHSRAATTKQKEKLTERKLAAAAGAPGARPRAKARPKYSKLDDVPVDDIKAEIDRREKLGIDVQ